MSEYGQVKFIGKALPSLATTSSLPLEVSSKPPTPYAFNNPKQKDSLTISPAEAGFCVDCTYLFECYAEANLRTTVLLHSEGSSVPLITGKTVHETLLPGDYEEYVFAAEEGFNLSASPLYGAASLKVTKESTGELLEQRELTKPETVALRRERVSTVYIVRVEAREQCSYSLLVTTTQRLAKLAQGIPSTFELASGSQCFYFPGSAQHNLSLLMESPSSADGLSNYTVRFKSTLSEDSEETVLEDIPVERGENVLLLRPVPEEGVYTVCVSPTDGVQQMSVLLLEAGVPTHLQTNKEIMVSAQGDPKIFEVYCPVKGWAMVEALECRGSIDIMGSKEYQSVLDQKPELKFTHSKTAGHYVGKAKVDPGLYFLGVSMHGSNGELTTSPSSESLAILRYSMFSASHGYPYDKFDVFGDETIRYKLGQDGDVTFTVDRVEQDGEEYKVIKTLYRLYVAAEPEKVKEASQCHSVQVLNKTLTVVGEDQAKGGTVSIPLEVAALDM